MSLDWWMADLTRNRVLSEGENRSITWNEQRGMKNRERSARPVTTGHLQSSPEVRAVFGLEEVYL
ncbi:MAG: hypothetical protein GX268_11875 [Methanomicrobiales archaeon]|nr:hypothetical protein [Methanomicrobiales archaeon]